MLTALTYAVIAASVLLLLLTAGYAVRGRLIDDLVLGLAALMTLALVVQVVTGLSSLGEFRDGDEAATFAAYLISLPFIPAGTVFLAIKEKTRWAMAAVAVGALAVAVMTVRLDQIWNAHG